MKLKLQQKTSLVASSVTLCRHWSRSVISSGPFHITTQRCDKSQKQMCPARGLWKRTSQLWHSTQEVLISDDWVRSHNCFYFPLFPSDFNHLWGSWWCRSMQWHLHPQRRHKMDRWRATSLPWGQVSRVDRDRIRQKPERESQWKGLQSKGEQKKREQSQRILPRSRIWIKVKASQKHTACENTVREGF